jgi:hypothetical protein
MYHQLNFISMKIKRIKFNKLHNEATNNNKVINPLKH